MHGIDILQDIYIHDDNERIRRNYCTDSQCESVVVLGIVLKCGAVRRWADITLVKGFG